MSIRLFSRADLLSEYRKSIVNNNLVQVIKPAPLATFRMTKVITEKEEADWKSLSKDDACRKLVAFVRDKDTLEIYIKFSKSVQFIKDYEAKKLFPFIPDLLEVGLHDPLQTKGSITLKPRPLASPGELVVLWIIHDEAVFDCFTALTEGTNYQCHTDLQGYVCKKSKTGELYAVHSNCQSKAPGRKFDCLLARFQPCPTLLVYSGSCQSASCASSTATAHHVIVSADSEASEFDLSTEAVHAIELCRLRQWRNCDTDFITNVIDRGRATRYAPEEGTTHCPDAVTFHTAAKKCEIPALAIVKVESNASSTVERYCKYVHSIVQELIDNL